MPQEAAIGGRASAPQVTLGRDLARMADMPEFLSLSRARSILACTVLLSMVVLANGAFAQAGPPGPPPPAAQNGLGPNPMCARLEGQLAGLDRGGNSDPARDDQIRRYQESQTRQQAELDRVTMQAKRMGCDSSGFFSLFNGQSAQCGPVNTQIQQMRANLDQITGNLERLRCGGAYFPISFATVPARFPDDEKTCKALCPAAEAVLYAHRNPGEDMSSAVSISGQPYTAR